MERLNSPTREEWKKQQRVRTVKVRNARKAEERRKGKTRKDGRKGQTRKDGREARKHLNTVKCRASCKL